MTWTFPKLPRAKKRTVRATASPGLVSTLSLSNLPFPCGAFRLFATMRLRQLQQILLTEPLLPSLRTRM